MSKKPISLDELFEAQNKSSTLATVEPVEGKSDFAKLTPWAEGQGCLCHLAREIPRAWIASVSPTGETHLCCGKTLLVVEVQFVSEAKLDNQQIMSLFSQAQHAVSSHHPAPVAASSMPAMTVSGMHHMAPSMATGAFMVCGNCSGNYPMNTRCCGHYVCPAGTECCNYLGLFRCCNNMGQPYPVGTHICGNP